MKRRRLILPFYSLPRSSIGPRRDCSEHDPRHVFASDLYSSSVHCIAIELEIPLVRYGGLRDADGELSDLSELYSKQITLRVTLRTLLIN